MMKHKSVFLALLGGIIYIWTGTLYISVAYTFFKYYDDITVCLITDCYFAILQALGYVFSIVFLKKSKNALSIWVPIVESLIIFCTGLAAFMSGQPISSVFWGSFMSFFTGAIMCYAITEITLNVKFSNRGKAFGLIYAVGSVGSLLLSLLDGGNALGENFVFVIYGALAVLSSALGLYNYKKNDDSSFKEEEYLDPVKSGFNKNDAVRIFVIFMFFVLSNIGLHFKISGGSEFESVVLSRAFYAVGLIAAGFINDRSRKVGALCAFLALGFGLLSPALQVNAGTSVAVQAIAYVFLGLPAIYRMIIFSDEAEKDHSKFPFVTLGVAAALAGQALGTFMGVWLEKDMMVLVCVMLILYIITGGVFFAFFSALYPNDKKEDMLSEADRKEIAFEKYVKETGLNVKQAQVLKYLLNGASNGEIAESLFVAESTVKYHVKNILQATSCHNRNELIEDFRNHYLNS